MKRGLVTLATAAVVSVYAAGYVRTEAAANRFQGGDGARRGTPESPPQAEQPPAASAASVEAIEEGLTSTNGGTASLTAPVTAASGANASAASAAGAAQPTSGEPVPSVASAAPAETPAAPVDVPTTTAETRAAGAPYKDGVYTGWGNSPHGRIEATVEVQGGRILSATITNCRMRWPCARIAYLVPQPAERQSAEVDVISRVTDSSDAFYYALVEALSKAK